MKERIQKLISQMTLEEKAALCSGKNFWNTTGVERLGVAPVMVTDGPHGLRKQAGSADHLGINQSVPATCFPPAATTASSWDPELLRKAGAAIGEEAAAEEVAVVLGPGTNIKRSPLCGRNFEYFSEDPLLAGEMSAALIDGVQSRGVGTSLKHYAANSQEKARLISNSVIDQRALREIYLTAFERAVKKSQPWTLMCSYNRINNVYSCENKWLLDDILRKEWGFQGLVMTDWGAMNDRVKALDAGLELEMPGPNDANDRKIVEAVKAGILPEAVLDRAVERLLEMHLKAVEVQKQGYGVDAHHRLARSAAAESMVLLKNGGMLPLAKGKTYAVVGAFAEKPRYQGAGSSKINPTRLDSVTNELEKAGVTFSYAPGYSLDGGNDAILRDEAKALAARCDAVVVFAGLPDDYESEGFDRTSLDMPESHNALIEAMTEVNQHVTVVLMCGSVVLMPWRDKVESILLAYLGGQAAGGACVDVLTGTVAPSGHLAETFPLCVEDTPSFGNFATEDIDVEYRESILVGYRYYDWAGKEVAYPFGHGLSYTTFSYDKMCIQWDDTAKIGTVKISVTNTGCCPGSEVVQLYVGMENSRIMRAPRELRGFAKVSLVPGESCTAEIALDARSFSYYDTVKAGWTVENGVYQIFAGASSRDLRLREELRVSGEIPQIPAGYQVSEVLRNGRFAATREQFAAIFGEALPCTPKSDKWTVNTPLKEVMADQKGQELFGPIINAYAGSFSADDDMGRMMLAMVNDMPLRALAMFGLMDLAKMEELIETWNR